MIEFPDTTRPLTDYIDAARIPLLDLVADTAAALVDLEAGDVSVAIDPADASMQLRGALVVNEPVALSLGDLPIQEVAIGDVDDAVAMGVFFAVDEDLVEMVVDGLPLTALVDSSILSDVATGGPGRLNGSVNLAVDSDGLFDISGSLAIPPSKVGGTDIEISATDLTLVLPDSERPEYVPEDFLGLAAVEATLALPSDLLSLPDGSRLEFSLADVSIGNNGFSGSVSIAPDDPADISVGGFGARLRTATITIDENQPTDLSLGVDLYLPFFDRPGRPCWIGVDIDLRGDVAVVELSDAQPPGATETDGVIAELTIPGAFRIALASLRMEATPSLATVWVTGGLQLLVDGVTWPVVAISDIGVDSDGNLHVPPDGISFETPLVVERPPVVFELTSFSYGMLGAGHHRISLATTLDVDTNIPVSLALADLAVEWNDVAVSVSARDLAITADPVALTVGRAELVIDSEHVSMALGEVDLGLVGIVENALVEFGDVATASGPESRFVIGGTASWADLAARIDIPDDVMANLEVPDAGEVHAMLRWEPDAVYLDASVGVSDLGGVLSFIPETARPEVRNPSLAISGTWPHGDPGLGDPNSQIDIMATAAAELRLPTAPNLDFIELETDDWLHVGLEFGTDGMAVKVESTLAVNVGFPGMATEAVPLRIEITSMSLSAPAQGGISVEAVGGFVFSVPPLPPQFPLAGHLGTLFAGVPPVAGAATISAGLDEDGNGQFSIECDIDAEITIDVLEMLSGLTSGLAPPTEVGPEVELHVDVGFDLQTVKAFLTSDGEAGIEIGVRLRAGALVAGAVLTLGTAGLEATLDDLVIPLEIPVFPLDGTAFDGLETSDHWMRRAAKLNHAVTTWSGADDDPELLDLQIAAVMFGALHLLERSMPSRGASERYATACGAVIGLMHSLTSGLHVDTDLVLEVTEAGLKIPFADPRAIELGGNLNFAGLAPEDPLAPLQSLSFGLGLGPDMVFARLKLDDEGAAIELPAFGGYSSVKLRIADCRIGYGYTRNSLAVFAAGSVELPAELVEDLDTSTRFGAGVRLPTHNSLGFRLDLIPIVLGPVDFILPLIELDIDLRTPGLPALADPSNCTPEWDGLELHVPNLVHADVKQLAISMFTFGVPCPSVRMDTDLELGSGDLGLRVVIDNFMVPFGLLGYIPIPFVLDPKAPWFDNICINARLAGFEMNVDLQRPVPSVNPLAIFEVLGLLSDPMMPVEHDGDLANTIRASLKHGRISVPPWIRQLAPALDAVVDKDIDLTVNVGTVITATQGVIDVASSALDAANGVTSNPPDLSPDALLGLIPPELRKIRAELALAGFEARGVLVLMGPEDIADELSRPAASTGRTVSAPVVIDLDAPISGDELTGFTIGAQARGRTHDPEQTRLLTGREFEGFDVDDLIDPAEVRPDGPGVSGIVIGAYVRVLNGQRFRFVGYLFSNGSFGLATQASIKPIELRVAGISVGIPIALNAGLRLDGRTRRGAMTGSVTGSGSSVWKPFPAIRVELAGGLQIWSDGRFVCDAFGSVAVGEAQVTGTIRVTEVSAAVTGSLQYYAGGLFLDLAVAGEIGPGPHFRLAGDGALSVLGQNLLDVSGELTENSARLSAMVDGWDFGSGVVDGVTMEVDGWIDLGRSTNPEFGLTGAVEIDDLLGVGLSGRGGIERRSGVSRVWAEGALSWQGRQWLQGSVSFAPGNIEISGHTRLTFDLTPTGDLIGADLAQLVFSIDLGGKFRLSPGQNDGDVDQGRVEIEGGWALGLRLPDNDGQVMPLATQRLEVGPIYSPLNLLLVDLGPLDLLPFGDLGDISGQVPQVLEFGPEEDGARIRGYASALPTLRLTTDDIDWSLPGRDFAGDKVIDVDIPPVRATDATVTIDAGEVLSMAADFQLRLIMIGGRLAIRVVGGGSHSDTFLDDLPEP